jgi:tRNA-specific 2-thiouridylase
MKAKVLVLFSGGMDSILAVKLLQKQGLRIEGINFVTPFSDLEVPEKVAKKLRLKLHRISVAREYFNIIKKPKHGYGANMNPCIDCKIYMLKRAKALAKKMNADFIATGEVLGERPFSQRRHMMKIIEKESGLKNKIVRPLSGRLMPVTQAEKRGLVDREKLLAIRGRSRKPQMRLAKQFGVKYYPTPGSGCLLTDPGFSKKLRDFLANEKTLTWKDVELLKLGRHFRLGKKKIIVGRNEQDNKKLLDLVKKQKLPWMEVKDYMGPVTVLQGKASDLVKKAAEITVRYSDAPNKEVEVSYIRSKKKKTIRSRPIKKKELEKLRII